MSQIEEMPKAYEPNSVEAKWYPFWESQGYFKGNPKSNKKPYSVVIPPPNVTGMLHLGHVLNNTLQDILMRWRRMQGYEACWFPGTDHAGIATESKVERVLRESGQGGRDTLGRDAFIEKVWDWKAQYGGTIINQLRCLGCSCDWERERFTMDDGLSVAVRKVFVSLYEKGYIYRGQRMINWCPVSKTALSDEEVIYKDVSGSFWHIRYPLSDGSGHLVVATTRPETLFGDTAVAVHPDDERYKDWIGKMVKLPLTDREIPIVGDLHADPTKGSGCVKITPAHDPNDFEVGLRHNLPMIKVMNDDATMNEKAGAYAGLDRFACRKKAVADLEAQGLLEKIEPIQHSVGYSERGDVPIETLISYQWFVKMEDLAKPALEAVTSGQIKFYPERWVKTYCHWLENIRDWCISRQIWWGHRIPAWYHEMTGEIYVGEVDPDPATGPWRQEVDVLDTWFSSWLWPFSVMDWPNESDEQKFFYPTSDLVTGPDIIFFWVARMIMAGLEFKGEIPFKNVYYTSIIRDDIGRKLSKSLGNSPDPIDVIHTYGADALRFSMIYIAPIGIDIRYSNDKCEIGRNYANKLWNAARFRTMQGEVSQNFNTLDGLNKEHLAAVDLWILGRVSQVISSVNDSLEQFRFNEACRSLYDFMWSEFCDWYIEASKKGWNNPETRETKLRVFDYVYYTVLRLLHPVMPFLTEELAHRLGFLNEGDSIMVQDYPAPISDDVRAGLGITDDIINLVESNFELIRAGRNLRSTYNIAPGKPLPYFFKPADRSFQDFIESEMELLVNLMRAEDIKIDATYKPDGAAPSVVTPAGTIFLPLEGIIDVDAEKGKLQKQHDELQGWISASKAKLSNERFVSKAPVSVVEEAKIHLLDLEQRLARVIEMLEAFGL